MFSACILCYIHPCNNKILFYLSLASQKLDRFQRPSADRFPQAVVAAASPAADRQHSCEHAVLGGDILAGIHDLNISLDF